MSEIESQNREQGSPHKQNISDWWPFALTSPPEPGTATAIIQKGIAELVHRQISRLGEMLDLSAVETVLESVKSRKQGDPPVSEKAMRALKVGMLALGVLQTARTLVRVCEDKDIDSGYVLGRTVVERAINYAFLAFSDDQTYHDWTRYSGQKTFRLLSRARKAGSVEFRFGIQPPLDASVFPELQRALNRFSGRKGGERPFSELPLLERLATIEGKFDSSRLVLGLLLQAYMHVYEIGAEAQHGSLFGVSLNYGSQLSPNETLHTHINILLISASLCLDSTFQILAHSSGNPEAAKEAFSEFCRTFEEVEATAREASRRSLTS